MNNLNLILTFLLLITTECSCDGRDGISSSNSNNYFEQTFDESEPFQKISDFSFMPIQAGFVHFSANKPKLLPVQVRRRKRSTSSPPSSLSSSSSPSSVAEDVCPSVSDWVAKSHAVDPYGNEVTIVQRIPINGTVVNQYFYETFCSSELVYEYDDFFGTSYRRAETPESTQCKGIDVFRWNSHCKENYIWTYGKVADASGHTGWSIIGIRGSCSCAIWPKPASHSSPHSLPLFNSQKYSSSYSSPGRGRRLISDSGLLMKSKIQSDPFF